MPTLTATFTSSQSSSAKLFAIYMNLEASLHAGQAAAVAAAENSAYTVKQTCCYSLMLQCEQLPPLCQRSPCQSFHKP